MFGEREGTEAARSLSSAERAGRQELARLRVIAEKTTDAGVRTKTQRRIAELERLVNRGEKIAGGELATRAAAEREPLDEEGNLLDIGDEAGELGPFLSIERPPDPLRQDVYGAPTTIARAMAGELTRAPSAEGMANVSAPQVIESLADVTAAAGKLIAQRVGRLGRGPQVLGWWNPRTQVIRTRSANDIPTATHEVAHAIEALLFGNPKGGPWREPRASLPMQRELAALGRALYGSTRPAAGYKREGWAEYLRIWVT